MLDVTRVSPRLPAASLAALVRSVAAAALARTRIEALSEIATAARSVTGSDVTLLRIPTADGDELEAAAVAGSAPLAAELAGTRVSVAELPAGALSDLALAPAATRRAAELARAPELCLVVAGESHVSLELLRAGDPFSPEERLAAELCAAHALLVLRAFSAGDPTESLARPALELVGEALAAALDESDQVREIVRLSATVAGATAAILWEQRGAELVAVAAHGTPLPGSAVAAEELPNGGAQSTTVPLGHPATGVLQLLHPDGHEPT